MNGKFIIIEDYYDREGYTHRKLYDYIFFDTKEKAEEYVCEEKKRAEENWEDFYGQVPDLSVVEIKKAD